MVQIITTIITSVCTLAGVVIATVATSRKQAAQVQTELAVIKTEMAELTREVRIHNNFAQRVPVLEDKVARLEKEGK